MCASLVAPVFAGMRPPTRSWVAALAGCPQTSLARRIADYIVSVRYEDLDPAAVDRAKEHLIYQVGLAFSGALTDHGSQAIAIARRLGGGRGESTVIGQSFTAPPLEAAFANATFMRALGFDDVLFPSATHPGLLNYPAALAVGEQQHSSGKDVLTAIVTGYEVLGKMIVDDPSVGIAPRRPSMPFGAFPVATVTSMLLRLDAAQTANAIGYAADSAMGLLEGNEQQPTHVYGWLNRNGITAAVVAQAGGETAPTILEGQYGFYASLVGTVPADDDIVPRLGIDPEILRATQKRYPGTAMNIVPIQMMLELVEQHGLGVDNVARVEFELPDDRIHFEDGHSTGPFPTRTQSSASVCFQTAIILLDGRIDFARYDQLDNPDILDVVDRMSVTLTPQTNTRYARIRITTVDGRTIERQGDDYVFPPIDGAAWLSRDGEQLVPRANLERFATMVQDLEQVEDIGELMTLLTPAN